MFPENMNDTLVSIVMCTYNGEKFVAEQLDSICRQTHVNLEIIIVDDASTDATYSILEKMANEDKRIRLHRNEKNIGLTKNFEKGCSLVTGSFVAIADQDDIWSENKIATLLEHISTSDDIVMVHGMSVRFEKSGKFSHQSTRLVNYTAGKDIRNFLLCNYISGHNMLFRKSLLGKALPFPKTVIYDWWLAAVAVCNGRIAFVPQVLVWHRMHETNATGKAKVKMLLHKQMEEILPELIKIPSVSAQHRNFVLQLMNHFKKLNTHSFSFPLFLFLVRHAPVLLSHKKRRFPWVSYTKHAFISSQARFKV